MRTVRTLTAGVLLALSTSTSTTAAGAGAAASTTTPEALIPGVAVADVTVVEQTNALAVFTLRLPFQGAQGASVRVTTRDVSATGTNDYVPTTTVVNLSGRTSVQLSVLIRNDTTPEGDEGFELVLSDPVKVRIPDAVAVATITDPDLRTAILPNDVALGEFSTPPGTDFIFSVRLNAPAQGTETVRLRTFDGTATAGSDFVGFSDNAVTFVRGQTTAFFSVTVTPDTTVEPDETFTVEAIGGTNVVLGADRRATGTILNDDSGGGGGGLRITSISNPTIVEGNSGTKALNFTVTLSGAATGTESFKISTANGTATAGSDYVARTNATITIPAGNTQRNVSITINGDTAVEANETLLLNIVSAIGLTIDDNQATGTITDND